MGRPRPHSLPLGFKDEDPPSRGRRDGLAAAVERQHPEGLVWCSERAKERPQLQLFRDLVAAAQDRNGAARPRERRPDSVSRSSWASDPDSGVQRRLREIGKASGLGDATVAVNEANLPGSAVDHGEAFGTVKTPAPGHLGSVGPALAACSNTIRLSLSNTARPLRWEQAIPPSGNRLAS